MRYVLASLITLLVVGAASAVPDDEATIAGRLPTAARLTGCEVVAEPVGMSAGQWDELRAALRAGMAPSAETVTGVETAVHEFVACQNERPDIALLPGIGSGRMALVWVGEPWLMPDNRVAAPVIVRQGAALETRSLLVLERQTDRYVVAAVLAFDARSSASSVFRADPLSG